MHAYIHTCIQTYIHTYIHMYIHAYVRTYNIHIYTVSKIVGLASQFAIQNCLGCYLKLNLGSKFHTEVATHLPHIKLRTLYTLNNPIHDLNSNFHVKIATIVQNYFRH